ncbi:hypothetical protein JOF35_002703 [Streptomyces demainii]|uniref:Secreted protein n=2 Tax=Streptomyces TaxID=1883 RepID=A0ABT9KPR0_9ACTN|nr:hypothetical protein [Streptomyces demainii]
MGTAPTQHIDTAPTQRTHAAPTQRIGTPSAQHMGTSPAQRMGTAPAQRVNAAPAQRLGTSSAQHMGTAPTQHIDTAPTQRTHAAPTPRARTNSAAGARARQARARLARLLVLPAVVLFAMLGGAPAQAADGYRYWSFWQRGGDGGGWTYSTQGPSSARPGDGDTIGFRFAVSEDSDDATRPRGTADFAAVCADTPAKDGTKRVAVVLDFGTAADAPDHRTPPAPRTECARVGEDASAGEALAAVAKPLRYNSAALLCAIAGYPESGCGDKVSSSVDAHAVPKSDGDKADGDSGPSAGLIGGLVAVVLLGAAAVWQARRRRA